MESIIALFRFLTIVVNKKKIKKGQQIVTELQKICGRVR